MCHNSTQNMYIRMSKAEIMQARKILAQRNELTRRNGFEAELCDPQFRSYYHPDSPKGQQIYQSYSDEELLDILIAVMQHHGHSPQFDKIHHVYKLYLSKRFENLAQAKAKARARQKAIAQQDKWPSNWSEHIDPEPFYKWIQEKGQEVTEEDKCVIEAICDDARKTGLPPELSSPECRYLAKFCNFKRALEMMNIPALRKNELRFMVRYWHQNETKQIPVGLPADK